MKLNISYPVNGTQKVIEIDDDNKLRAFYDKRISHEVDGSALGDEFKGYIFKISGGNDKQGFAMMQGVLTTQRVRLLMRDGMPSFRIRKRGERKRKSVRGCIVSSDLSVLNLVIVKKGDNEIEGLTNADSDRGRRLGPKRANKIRKLFNLSKEDDVRKYVVRRTIKKDGKKSYTKAPKIQRLVTPQRLQHKRRLISIKRQHWEKTRSEAAAYNELLALRFKESRESRASKLAKRRSESKKESTTQPTTTSSVAAPTTLPSSSQVSVSKPASAKSSTISSSATNVATKPAAVASSGKASTAKSSAATTGKPATSKPSVAAQTSKPAAAAGKAKK